MATEIVTRYPGLPDWMKHFGQYPEDHMQRRLRQIEERLSRIEDAMRRGVSNPSE